MYEPSDDSYFFEKYINSLNDKYDLALDMGTGSGILAKALLKKSKKVLAVDIQQDVIEKLDLDVEKHQSNLFFDLPKNYLKKIDLIVFNPPYLPLGEDEFDVEVHGGILGVETTIKFLKQAKKFLSPKGKILFIASNNANLEFLNLKLLEFNYKYEIKDELKLFFEKLYIYEAKKV
ncbi:MAG: HemK2/MTQ2 family protein methyltransferase [Candidatus Woesearchaeota archaeon]